MSPEAGRRGRHGTVAARVGGLGRRLGAEEQTFLMPPRSDAALVLLADHDPVDDGLVTLGYLFSSEDRTTEVIEILDTSDRKAEADALVGVFSRLISDL